MLQNRDISGNVSCLLAFDSMPNEHKPPTACQQEAGPKLSGEAHVGYQVTYVNAGFQLTLTPTTQRGDAGL